MKHTRNDTPRDGGSTYSKLSAGIGSKYPLTHAWWIYRANQMKMQSNPGTQLLAQPDSFPDEAPPTPEMDAKQKRLIL
jgi:hypothetical protein